MADADPSKSGVTGDDQDKTTSEGSEQEQPAAGASAQVNPPENLDQTAYVDKTKEDHMKVWEFLAFKVRTKLNPLKTVISLCFLVISPYLVWLQSF